MQKKDRIISMRRDLHRIPEIALKEKKASSYVAEADCLRGEGFELQTGIAQYGVAGLMVTGNAGPTLMIQGNTVGFLIAEETGFPFALAHKCTMQAKQKHLRDHLPIFFINSPSQNS